MGIYMFGGIAKSRSDDEEEDESLNSSKLGKQSPGREQYAYIEGSNKSLKYSNELWLIRPDYQENAKKLKQNKNPVT